MKGRIYLKGILNLLYEYPDTNILSIGVETVRYSKYIRLKGNNPKINTSLLLESSLFLFVGLVYNSQYVYC